MHGERLITPQQMASLEKAFKLSDGLMFIPGTSENAITSYPTTKLGKHKERSPLEYTRDLIESGRKERKDNCIK